MEKADVTEMTVRYIKDLHQLQTKKDNESKQLALTSYIQGFTTCIDKVTESLYHPDDMRSSPTSQLSSTINYSPDQSCLTLSPSSDRIQQTTSTPCQHRSRTESIPSYNDLSPIYNSHPHHSPLSFDYSAGSLLESSAPSPTESLSSSDSSTDPLSVWRQW